jgi:hypothetical protein
MQLQKTHSNASPPQWELNALQPGRHVRLHIDTGQVVWARCTTLQQRDGTYAGEVEHAIGEGIRTGAAIRFRKYHVWAIA